MENPTLAEGSSFGDIVSTPETQEAQATPEVPAEEAIGATDGSKTSDTPPEVPGILKDDESEEGKEETPDLSIDPDLEKHPVLKAKWEAYKAQKERGIQKFIEEQKAQTTELSEFKTQYEPLVSFYNEFENPSTVDDAYARMCGTLAKTYGRSFDGYTGIDAQGNPIRGAAPQASAQDDGDSGDAKSKYGFEFASEDRILEKTAEVILPQLEKLLDSRLGPVAEDFKSRQAEREASTKATQALPALKAEFEVSADPWITPEKVSEAVKAHPTLEPRIAFAAHFVKEIARYTAKHSGTAQTVRNLPSNEMGAKPRSDLREGADMATILLASDASL